MVMLVPLLVAMSGCRDVLIRDLSEAEANDIVEALAEAGVAARKVGQRRLEVTVPAGEVGVAWGVLRAAGLPREPMPEVPERLVVGPTEAMLVDRHRQAVALERVLRGLEGARDARVVLGEAGASVVVRGRVDAARAREIVAGALPRNTEITLKIEDLSTPVVATAGDEPSRAVVALSAAVVALSGACGLLLVQLRRLRRLRRAP